MGTRQSLYKPNPQFFKAHWAALLWALFVLVLCLLPGDTLPDIDFWEINFEDKLAHMGVFAILAGFAVWGEQRRQGTTTLGWRTKVSIVLICAVFGFTTEILQGAFVPTRYASVSDALADWLGAILGTIFAPWVLRVTGLSVR